MTRFDKMQADCHSKGIVKSDPMDGGKVCGCSRDRECTKEDCPSLKYWGGDRQIGYHSMRALECYNYEDQYKEEMA
jgi:hypothetical protein